MKPQTLLALLIAAQALLHPGDVMSQLSSAENSAAPLVGGISEFSVNMYRALAREEKGNVVVSPISAHVLLTALHSAAVGPTKSELKAVLRLAGDAAQTDAAYRALLQTLNQVPTSDTGPAYNLTLVNAAWLSKEYPLKDAFRMLMQESYFAQFSTLDFSQPVPAAAAINKWVAEKTAGKVEKLVPEEALSNFTRLVLTNAVYFKSRWAEPFDLEVTQSAAFYTGSATVQTPLMNNIQTVPYFEDERLQAIKLPYEGGGMQMVVLLPRDKDGLGQFEASLSEGMVAAILSQMGSIKVNYFLPRFTFSAAVDLGATLKQLGLATAFEFGRASFPGITETEQLAISKVLQRCFVAVDERGTEAAAGTAIMMVGSGFDPQQPRVFRADHPFLFMIMHEQTGALLFLGRVNQPAAA